jgi:hypothetical protein
VDFDRVINVGSLVEKLFGDIDSAEVCCVMKLDVVSEITLYQSHHFSLTGVLIIESR